MRQKNPITERKRHFLADWVMKNPFCTMDQARQALREEFGEILSTADISFIIKSARTAHQERVSDPSSSVTPASVDLSSQSMLNLIEALVSHLRTAGVNSIQLDIDPDGRYNFRRLG